MRLAVLRIPLTFSTDPDSCQPTNILVSTAQLYTALQKIFTILPQYKDNDLFLFGESYAGNYIPRLANYILDANNGQLAHQYHSVGAGDINLNLKGLGVGDGLVDPETQFQDVARFAYQQGLITSEGRDMLQTAVNKCESDFYKYDKNVTNAPFVHELFKPCIVVTAYTDCTQFTCMAIKLSNRFTSM